MWKLYWKEGWGNKNRNRELFLHLLLLSHEHPKWGYPRMAKDGGTLGQGKCIGHHHLTTQPCTWFWVFYSLTTLEGDGFSPNLESTPRNTRAIWGWGREKGRERKKYSSTCLLGTIGWLMNISKGWFFFPIIFVVVYWTSLWRLKLQGKMSYEGEKNDLFASQIKEASLPSPTLFIQTWVVLPCFWIRTCSDTTSSRSGNQRFWNLFTDARFHSDWLVRGTWNFYLSGSMGKKARLSFHKSFCLKY